MLANARPWGRDCGQEGTLEDGNDEEVASYPKDERSDHNDGLLDVDVQVEGDHGEELPDAEHEHAQEAEELKQTGQLPSQRGGGMSYVCEMGGYVRAEGHSEHSILECLTVICY